MWCTTLLHYSSLYEEIQWYRKKIMGIIYIFSLMTKSKTLPYSMLRTLKNFSLHFSYQKNVQENSASAAYTSQGRLFHLRLSTIGRRVTRLKQFKSTQASIPTPATHTPQAPYESQNQIHMCEPTFLYEYIKTDLKIVSIFLVRQL